MIKRNLPGITLALASAIIICVVWGKIISAPNHWLLTSGGDAFKNYYTPAWYVANDTGTHFTGMQFPFGEHVVFTDNQPMLTWIINGIDNNIFPLQNNTIGILHILMFVSIWAGILLMFHILRYYRMPAWYAAWIALCIGLLAPQIERFYGHFALSYTVFIPSSGGNLFARKNARIIGCKWYCSAVLPFSSAASICIMH